MLKLIRLLLVITAVLADDIVQVKQGRLRGHRLTSRMGRNIFAFQGIPYAKAPIGELRFEAPQPPEPWSGLFDASKEGAECIQKGFMVTDMDVRGQEDCLFLNVYTPQLPQSGLDTKPLDVMFWIHGGGWFSGSGNSDMYGPQYLLDHDVILVTINYRLGALGFLSTGDAVCPGNNGLKDQRAALHWVKDNIAAFGGNPNSVTIFGESAGGGSVHHHMISPSSKGLFHRAISESGNAVCCWSVAQPGSSKELSKKVASLFNCPTEPSFELISCLKKQDANDIYSYDIPERTNIERGFLMTFKPVIEPEESEAFITEDPIKVLLKPFLDHQLVPWMTGTVSSEGGFFPVIYGNRTELNLEEFPLVAELFEGPVDQSVIKDVGRKIHKFYFGDELVTNKSISSLINMFTDWYFLSGTNTAVKLHSQRAAPVYYYYFDYRGSNSFSEKFGGDPTFDYGVVHLDELLYLFPQNHMFPNSKPTPQDEKMVDIMTTLWTNFARTGDPTADNAELDKWTPVSSPDLLEYAHIGSHGVDMKHGLHKGRTQFWESLPIKNQYSTLYKDEL